MSVTDERNMSMEHWWNDSNKGETEVLREKRVPLPLLVTTNRKAFSTGLLANNCLRLNLFLEPIHLLVGLGQ
jgi:hypothetical protein